MNYYEHHIGDWAAATAHLSLLEDAVYSRCIRRYYADEKPLPAEVASVQRLVGARSKEERQAVEVVLQEFFTLQDDGWHNKRCDAEIARFQDSLPDRDAKRENERERQRRTRERRKQLFDVLREHGVVPAYDTPMSELQDMVSRVASQPVTPPVTRDNTATQTPDTKHQTPSSPSVGSPTPAGKVCMAMRQAGLAGVNPGHPDLLALLEAGATEDEIAGATQAAVDRGKASFAYVLAMLKRQRQEAAAMASSLHRGALPRNLTAAEQRVLQAVPSLAAPHLRPVITTPLEDFHAAPLALG